MGYPDFHRTLRTGIVGLDLNLDLGLGRWKEKWTDTSQSYSSSPLESRSEDWRLLVME